MINIENVNKYFNHRKKNEIHIINDTSLELEDKGLIAILGHSGSGKTTLLNAIGGLDKINNGKIFINGEKITKRRTKTIDRIRNLNIGYIFQDYKLIENMSVFDNIAISLKMIGIKDKNEIEKRVNYVLESVNMYRYKNRPAQMLSGGEKQRVAIARAIVKNPSIVIADEPTGNLDSKNSLEIMNIIKAISKDKLVILVTHEVELANFYATRIINVQDGKVVKDSVNDTNNLLEYRQDNKIYLKDFDVINNLNTDKFNIDVYSDKETDKLDIKLIIKNGNIFIESKDKKIEIVDDNSSIELIDDHYKKIDKSIYEEYEYSLDKIADSKFKSKYSSIYGLIKSIRIGLKRIVNYTILKKILLFGFFISSLFIVYSVTNIAGITNIKESDYIEVDKNYVKVELLNTDIDKILKYEKLNDVDYVIPGNSAVSFQMKMDEYYQLSMYSFDITGSLVEINQLKDEDIIKGRMPENEYEIIIDKKIIDEQLEDSYSYLNGMGIKSADELLDKEVSLENMKNFKIVGLVDKGTLSIYTYEDMFINIINNSSNEGMSLIGSYSMVDEDIDNTETPIQDYKLFLDDITLTKGRMPENDYEVIVNKINEDEMKLNKKIETTVNDKKLTVVGYYESKTNNQIYLVNSNTVKYNIIRKSDGFMLYTKEKTAVINKLKEDGLNAKDCYEESKNSYLEERKDEIKSSIIFASVILVISLFEIYLMMRASFLSRIKEVGILRAIGVMKKDIYKMFLGEILSITTIFSMSGVALMTYILYQLTRVSYIKDLYVVNPLTIGISIVIIYGFNILVGLLPLHKVLRKTPAQILSRNDI